MQAVPLMTPVLPHALPRDHSSSALQTIPASTLGTVLLQNRFSRERLTKVPTGDLGKTNGLVATWC